MENLHYIISSNNYFQQWVDCSEYTSGALSYIKLAEITSAPPEQDPLVKLYTLYIAKDQQLSLFALDKNANSQLLGLSSKVTMHNVQEVSEKLNKIESATGLLNSISLSTYNEKRVQFSVLFISLT